MLRTEKFVVVVLAVVGGVETNYSIKLYKPEQLNMHILDEFHKLIVFLNTIFGYPIGFPLTFRVSRKFILWSRGGKASLGVGPDNSYGRGS